MQKIPKPIAVTATECPDGFYFTGLKKGIVTIAAKDISKIMKWSEEGRFYPYYIVITIKEGNNFLCVMD
jgi:hypothetical protein